MIARFGHADALRSLVSAPPHASCDGARAGPFIKAADYPDVLVAKAVHRDGALFAVLYPGKKAGFLFRDASAVSHQAEPMSRRSTGITASWPTPTARRG